MSNQPRWPSTWTWLHVPIATSPWASEEVSARARTVSSLPWDSAGSWSCVQLKELIWHRLRLRIVSGKSLVSFTKVQGWMQSIASTRRSSGQCWTWSLALALTLTAGISSNQFCKADFLGADFLRAAFCIVAVFSDLLFTQQSRMHGQCFNGISTMWNGKTLRFPRSSWRGSDGCWDLHRKIALPTSRRHWRSARWHRSYTSSWWFTATRRMGAVWDNLPNPEYAGVVLNLMLIVILHASTVQLLRKLESWVTGTLRRKLLWSRLSSRSFLVLFLNVFLLACFFLCVFVLQSFAVSWINFYSIPTFFYFCYVSHCLRDYGQEVEAAVTAKLPTWKVQHLGLWADLIEPQASHGPVVSASELMELEDEAQAAKFREVRTKLSQDISAMCSYNSSKEECTRRSHVVKVMHEKSQVEAGKELLVKHVQEIVFFKIIFGIFVFSCAIKTYQNIFLFL